MRDSRAVVSLVSGAVLAGDLFGGSRRIKNDRAIEYDHFSVALLPRDTEGDHVDDDWERSYFDGTGIIDGSADSDGDGVFDFFEYLYGSDPTNPAEQGFRIMAAPSADGEPVAFTWHVKQGLTLDTDYRVRISTNLSVWDPLPPEHYSLLETTVGDRTNVELGITHDYGDRVFIRLAQP